MRSASSATTFIANRGACALAATLALLAHAASSTSLAGQVELLRDTWGIPHVVADAESDGFFGLGYACAEDRRLQMELIRRKASGRLAEAFGPDWIDADRAARIAGYTEYAPQAFARLPTRWQDALRAYAAGVNAWTRDHPDDVAHRFGSVPFRPESWTPADCLLAARGVLALGSPFDEASLEAYYRAQPGATPTAPIAPGRSATGMVIDESVAVVSEAEMVRDAAAYDQLRALPRMLGYDLTGAAAEPRKMSHAWAVSGNRSTTGKPILESDPQLPLGSPPFFHEFHLRAGDLDARGLGIPGCPGLFIGWNRHLAWGASALGVDAGVTFIDRLTPAGPGFEFRGATESFQRRLEQIEVRGQPPVIQEVLTSRHGTVFNSLARVRRPGVAYLAYDAQTMDGGTSARMMLEALAATNGVTFREALSHYYAPGLHVVYAEATGQVGYHTVVHRPATSTSPRRALEGWEGRHEIAGRIPFELLPHLLDPASGFVSHANNLPVGLWYPFDLGIATGGTGDTSRSWRLRQMLAGTNRFSVDDFEQRLHRDDLNPVVAALWPVARQVVQEDGITDPGVLRLLDSLGNWDARAASAPEASAARALENTLTPYRAAGLQSLFGAGGGGVSHLARWLDTGFVRDRRTPTNTLIRAYLVNWLRFAAESRQRGQATVPTRSITIPYQQTPPLNLPAVDPSLTLTSPPLVCLDQGTIWSQPGNLYSQIVDLADVDRSRSMIAPGNAEGAEDPNRTNQIPLWARGQLHPAPLSLTALQPLVASRRVVTTQPYAGPTAAAPRTLDAPPPATARLLAALPPPSPETVAPKLPGRKPDDPQLEAAFRFLLRPDRSPGELDARLDEVRRYLEVNPGLRAEFREALVLGIHLIEESAAGRLKVQYGSPQCLERLKALLAGTPPSRPP